MESRQTVAVLVAHPDDETLWAGGTLLSSPDWDPFVCTASRASDLDRAPRFRDALRVLRAEGGMADLDDGPEQRPLADALLEEALLGCLPRRRFERIITHSPLGEYTRHRRHEEVACAVLRLWLSGALATPELWLFAYDDDAGQRSPSALPSADIFRELSPEVWQQKYSMVTDCYGFTEASWEARITPRTEAFFRVTTPEQAVTWLQQRRTP
ncbi:MAG: PIG-L family deacetylase [Pseudomonadota bacterium]